MQVISSYTPPKSLDTSPYPSPRAASSSSPIFDRRSSTRGLDPHSELALSVDHAVFVKFHGESSRTGVGVQHPVRRSSPRTFAPLTPIIASPITTPTTSMSTIPLYLTSDKESAKQKLITLQQTSLHEQDYLTKGIQAPIPLSDEKDEKAVPVLDKSPTWTSTPPTPPPKPPRYRSVARRASSSVPPSASLPTSLNPHAHSSKGSTPRRRASLPPMALSKPLPLTPPQPPSKSHRLHPSKHSSRLSGSPLRDGVIVLAGRSSSKPIFHVLGGSSDGEDDGSRKPLTESPKEMFLEQRIKGASISENGWLKAKKQDDIRRYHALSELLTTEEGYLMDLRELVNGYIRQLPTLSCRPITNSSSNLSISPFTRSPTSATFMTSALSSNSRSPSHSQLPLASPLLFPESQTASTPSKDKNATRYMFSDDEVELVTRNVEEILRFHEVFVDELRAALIPLGFSWSHNGSDAGDVLHMKQKKGIGPPEPPLEAAVAVVSKTFARQAARFDLYETFCAGHPEAFDIVRKLQRAHTVEWDAFEQRSSQLVADLRKPVSYTQTVEGRVSTPALEDIESFEAHRKRRHSLSSLDVPARPLRVPNIRSNANLKHAATASSDTGAGRDKNPRLVFMDYLIKPVQRICKYPLLLDQLKTGKSFRRSPQQDSSSSSSCGRDSTGTVDANAVVETALEAMKHVASCVDEARRRQDISTKSSLIATRISNPFAPQASSSLRHNLSPVFLSSLGACLLAGSMDVIHHYVDKIPGSSGTVKAKYLGAFLYMGGYLILVKVSKGKVYEPRHWFSLADFELVDVSEEEALLPCSFRLSSKGHLFDMAAACQREKDVWISAFRESLTLPPSWSNEPVSSLQVHGRSDFPISMIEDGPSEGIPPVPPLPTIQSIPELQDGADVSAPLVIRIDTTLPRGLHRPDSVILSLPPSRRSSTASVKAIFSPVSESTILIRRSSPPARLQVERGLLDVFSDICTSARFHANTHEEELFQAPKVVRSGFSRSSSGLGMAGMGVAAKNRLTKRESVLVQRRTSGIEGCVLPPEEEVQMTVLKRTSTAKSLTNRRHAKKLKIVSMPLTLTSEGEVVSGDILPDTPPALSQCSSVSASNSAAGSPVTETMPLRALPIRANTNIPRPDLLVVREVDYRPKRSRSMVDNVKGIFQSRSSSSASSVLGDQSLPPSPEDPRPQWNASLNSGLFKWWSGTLRRRARSAPGAPEELLPFTPPMYPDPLPTAMSTPPIVVRRNKTTTERRPGLLSTSESGQLCAYTAPATTTPAEAEAEAHFQRNASPVRQRSLFSSTTSRRHSKAFTKDEPAPSLRLQRNFSFFQRLSPLTSTTHSEIA